MREITIEGGYLFYKKMERFSFVQPPILIENRNECAYRCMQEKRKGPDKQPDSLQMNTPQDRTSLMPLPHQVDHHPYVVILSIM